MRTLNCSQMKSAIETILTSHGLIQEFQSNPEFAVRITNDPYLPLAIERHGSEVTVTHYIKENGDLLDSPAWTEIRGF